MAVIGPKTTCSECNSTYYPTAASGRPFRGCPQCEQAIADGIEAAHFAALDEMTVEERLRKIEKWQYHYKAPRNKRDIRY